MIIYKGLVTQIGTSAPSTETLIEKGFSGDYEWRYVNEGEFQFYKEGLFKDCVVPKITGLIFLNGVNNPPCYFEGVHQDDDSFILKTGDGDNLLDYILRETEITIEGFYRLP